MKNITRIGLWILGVAMLLSSDIKCSRSREKSESPPQPSSEAKTPTYGSGATGPSGTIFGPYGADPIPMSVEKLRSIIEGPVPEERIIVRFTLEYPGSPVAYIMGQMGCRNCPSGQKSVRYVAHRQLGGQVWTEEDWMKAPNPAYWEMDWPGAEIETTLPRLRELSRKISEIPPEPIVMEKDADRLRKRWGYSVNYSPSRFNVLVLFIRAEMEPSGTLKIEPSLDYTFSCDPVEKKCDEVWQTYKRLFLDEIRKKYPEIPSVQSSAGATPDKSSQ